VIDGTLPISTNVPKLAKYLRKKVETYVLQYGFEPRQIHIVAHSMGGLITREFLTKYESSNLPNIGDVFMLGTPNAGTPIAYIPYFKNYSSKQDLRTDYVRGGFATANQWPDRGSLRLFLVGGTSPNSNVKY
jgi:triacylglycerol esterase/lipase EstA (alpha/beta hydrolase family)